MPSVAAVNSSLCVCVCVLYLYTLFILQVVLAYCGHFCYYLFRKISSRSLIYYSLTSLNTYHRIAVYVLRVVYFRLRVTVLFPLVFYTCVYILFLYLLFCVYIPSQSQLARSLCMWLQENLPSVIIIIKSELQYKLCWLSCYIFKPTLELCLLSGICKLALIDHTIVNFGNQCIIYHMHNCV